MSGISMFKMMLHKKADLNKAIWIAIMIAAGVLLGLLLMQALTPNPEQVAQNMTGIIGKLRNIG